MMEIVVGITSVVLIVLVLWDGFTNVVLPRTLNQRFSISGSLIRYTWQPWGWFSARLRNTERRDVLLSIYGPFFSILQVGFWATLLIIGFAGLHWALGSDMIASEGTISFGTDLYQSGVTFFTLGYGDVSPRSGIERFVAVIEAGIGFGFLAIIISYVPVLYQSYSRRETLVSMLEARAGSPSSAVELLRRVYQWGTPDDLSKLLSDWEVWVADVMESHLSHSVLALYRSHHAEQSWIAALTTILDTCVLIMTTTKDVPYYSAFQTYSLAQHAVVDIAEMIHVTLPLTMPNRLPPADFVTLKNELAEVGIACRDDDPEVALAQFRRTYEPYVAAIATALQVELPPWLPATRGEDFFRKRIKRADAVHHH